MQDKKKEEKTDEISLEELIEEKRAEMSRQENLTKVTLQTFVQWKKRKIREKLEKEKKDKEKKKEKFMAGAKVGMSGREMFMFDPKMVQDEVSGRKKVLRLLFRRFFIQEAIKGVIVILPFKILLKSDSVKEG